MTQITILGGTGYAGAAIAREAVSRKLGVTSWTRQPPTDPIDGVEYRIGSVLDSEVRDLATSATDVVVVALAPRGEMAEAMRPAVLELATAAAAAGVRIGVVGGAGSLQVSEGGPRLVDTKDFPDAFKGEATTLGGILEDLKASEKHLDWFFVSPAQEFGSYNPGEATGHYRVGGEVLVTDENGRSAISGADFAKAFVDEIEAPKHSRRRFTVAY